MMNGKTQWVTVANIAMAVAVVVCVLTVVFAIGREIIRRLRRRHAFLKEVDRDMARFFNHRQ